jgi:hypothetical protein
MAAGCGADRRSGADADEDVTVARPTAPGSTESSTPGLEPTPAVDMPESAEYVFVWDDGSGVKVRARLRLTSVFRAVDTARIFSAWKEMDPEAPEVLSCLRDPASSGIAVGSVSFEPLTPGYLAQPDIRFVDDGQSQFTSTPPLLDVEYSDQPSCGPAVLLSGDFQGLSPHLESGTWGPVPVALVYPRMFTPNEPQGTSDARELIAAHDLVAMGNHPMTAESSNIVQERPERIHLQLAVEEVQP